MTYNAEPISITQSNSHWAGRPSNRPVLRRLRSREVEKRADGNLPSNQVVCGAAKRRKDPVRSRRSGNPNLRKLNLPAPRLQPMLVREAPQNPASKSLTIHIRDAQDSVPLSL